MRHPFAHPLLLTSLGVLPLLAVLALRARRRRRQALVLLGSLPGLTARVATRHRVLGGLSLVLGLALVGVGAAGPQWGRDWEQSAAPGRDLVVVLDCSYSMFAETPSRLERARDALLDLCTALEKRGGHRVGLVLCAARARLACPLTHDCDHLRDTLRQVVEEAADDPEIQPGPGDVSGTRLGAGLMKALEAHDPRFRGRQDILLLSDGDDPARGDGEWRPATAAARAQGIAVHVAGLGDPDTASPVRLGQGLLTYQGREVRTRLEEAPLREIAGATHGMYVAAHTRSLPLGAVYLDGIVGASLREESDDVVPVYRQHYLLFLLPAFGLLASSLLLAGRSPRPRPLQEVADKETRRQGDRETGRQGDRETGKPDDSISLSPCLLVSLSALLLAAAPSRPDPEALMRQGYAAFARGDYAAAADLYERASLRATDPGLATLNLAAAKYHLALETDGPSPALVEAEGLYRCCVGPNDPRRARALYGLGNCLLRKAAGRDAASLRAALACYEQCLQVAGGDAELAADAAHNRERARLLVLQVLPQPGDSSEDRPPGDAPNSPPTTESQSPGAGFDVQPGMEGRPDARAGASPARPDPGTAPAQTDAPPPPGAGNLPPIPDQPDLPPLSARDAAIHLENANLRIARERRDYRRHQVRPPAEGVPGW
jgi:Ca-activated chloride channel family protein